jgi:hypothetical protein
MPTQADTAYSSSNDTHLDTPKAAVLGGFSGIENDHNVQVSSMNAASATTTASATVESASPTGVAGVVDTIRSILPNDEDADAEVEGGAVSFSYMKSSWFWVQVGGSMVIAMGVGIQMI